MPTYEYECEGCSHHFDEFQSFHDKPLKKCPKCKKPKLRRLFGTGSAILFKGSGFYETDYRSESYKSAAKADTEASSKTESSTSKESSKSSDSKSSASKPSKKDWNVAGPMPCMFQAYEFPGPCRVAWFSVLFTSMQKNRSWQMAERKLSNHLW